MHMKTATIYITFVALIKKKCFSEVWKQILNAAFNWKKKENLSLVLNNIPMTYNITSREKKESCGKILLHWDLAI